MKKVLLICSTMLFGYVATQNAALASDDDELDINKRHHNKIVQARLSGAQEVPAISTVGKGVFLAKISSNGEALKYRLRYAGMEGDVLQAHIHFAQKGANGGVSVFLCTNLGNGPAGVQACPASPGEVEGMLTKDDVVGPGGQGISAGEFAEFVRALVKGLMYINVHSSVFPSGELRGQVR